MYLHNKYTSWYYSIINNAICREINNGYVEHHHIVPKSLGGQNDQNNLVYLTAREHVICHRLLTKMTQGLAKQKMSYAYWAMCNQNNPMQSRYKVGS